MVVTFTDDQVDAQIRFAEAAGLPVSGLPYVPPARTTAEPPDSLISPPCDADNWMGEDE